MRRRVTVVAVAALALVLVAVAVVVGVRWWRGGSGSAFEQATTYAPEDAQRLSWTDWSAIRHRVGSDAGAGSSTAQLQRLLDKAYDDDLSSTSALVQSAPVLQAKFGFSPASADWELFSQSDKGAVVIIKMPDSTDLDEVGRHLEDAGFQKPAEDGGVWIGGESLLPKVGADLTPELQYVALDPDDHLVLTSDTGGYLQDVVDGLGGDDLPGPVQDVVAASGDPLTATVFGGDQACTSMAMSQADSEDQATGSRLISEAGRVNPLTAYAMSVQPGGHVRVVMGFEDGEQARTNAKTRATLAAGPAPGQGGDFSDRFKVASASAEGDLATLDLKPVPGSYMFSDLANGPVLFATC